MAMDESTHGTEDLGSKPSGGGCIILGATGSNGNVQVTLLDGLGRQVASGMFGDGSYRFDGLEDGNYQVQIDGSTLGSISVSSINPIGTLDKM